MYGYMKSQYFFIEEYKIILFLNFDTHLVTKRCHHNLYFIYSGSLILTCRVKFHMAQDFNYFST